ncbi:MAG: hypothetical protein HC913_13720 [Microscillaceae bacterium]|nr:hypothetical protein [Microscillaceae bacterium]
MHFREITFAALREQYESVRIFLMKHAGLEADEIGIYADLEEHLQIDKEDLFFLLDMFMNEFQIKIENEIAESEETAFWEIDAFSLSRGLLFCLIASLYHFPLETLSLLLSFVLTLAGLILAGFLFAKRPHISLPSKKAWNPASLSVADLVCLATEKEVIYKKDLRFVLIKSGEQRSL